MAPETPTNEWQIQEAKQRFSELVRRARRDGPQFVTKHGEKAVVVLDIEQYHQLAGQRMSFKDMLLAMPSTDDLEIERSELPVPEVHLGEPE